MLLPADAIGFAGEVEQTFDIIGRIQPEMMRVVARRETFDLGEQRIFESAGEDEVAGHPVTADGQLGEAHPHLEGDSGFLGKHGDGSEALEHRDEAVEDLANLRRPAGEMVLEVEWAAGVGLVAVGEGAAALRALPEIARRSHLSPPPPSLSSRRRGREGS